MAFGLSAGAVALIGAGATVAGTALAANGARKAGQIQAEAADRNAERIDANAALDREDRTRIYNQQREDYTPFREVGVSSIRDLAARSAPGGEFTKTYERGAFEADPGYQFRLEQGEKAIQRQMMSSGRAYSGATLKALARFGDGLGAQEYGAWDARENNREAQFNQNREFQRNNIASMAGIGQTATAGTVQAGSNLMDANRQAGQFTVQQQAQAGQAAGEARASGYVGAANAIGGGVKSIFDSYQQNRYLNGTPPPRVGGGSEIANWQNWGE